MSEVYSKHLSPAMRFGIAIMGLAMAAETIGCKKQEAVTHPRGTTATSTMAKPGAGTAVMQDAVVTIDPLGEAAQDRHLGKNSDGTLYIEMLYISYPAAGIDATYKPASSDGKIAASFDVATNNTEGMGQTRYTLAASTVKVVNEDRSGSDPDRPDLVKSVTALQAAMSQSAASPGNPGQSEIVSPEVRQAFAGFAKAIGKLPDTAPAPVPASSSQIQVRAPGASM